MKQAKLVVLLSIIIILNGCAAWVSSEHQNGYRNGHHNHNRVSVGIHSRGSGKGALGALIVGGIIGAVINQASHESKEKELEEKKQVEKQAKEKRASEQNQTKDDLQRLNNVAQTTKWFQIGKDGKCYEMQTKSGITDILKSVEPKHCNQ